MVYYIWRREVQTTFLFGQEKIKLSANAEPLLFSEKICLYIFVPFCLYFMAITMASEQVQ